MKNPRMIKIRRLSCFLLFVIGLGLLSGCGGFFKKIRSKPAPIVLLGIDGLEWDVLLPLAGRGLLPNLAGLMKNGLSGKLATLKPTLSPVIWTSVATGKVPKKHGIRRFVSASRQGKPALANSRDRKTKAVWDIASDYKRAVNVIGWWMTFPVDKIRGIMVAQTNAPAEAKPPGAKDVWKGALLRGVEGQVFPAKRQEEMMAVLDEVDKELPELARQIFGEFSPPLSGLSQRLWASCQWAFRADETYRRIALKLARRKPVPELTCLYFGGTDVVSHRFWRYMRPRLYRNPPTAEELANFGKVIENYYIYIDRIVGEIQQAYGPEATLIIVSDHGFEAVHLDDTYDSGASLANVNSAHHFAAPPGVLIAAGPLIQGAASAKPLADLSGDSLEIIGSVLDITPTLLALMEIPIGKDMDGKIIQSVFPADLWAASQIKSVPTHDTPAFLAGRKKAALDDPDREKRLEQLRSLGYIGQEKEKELP